MTQITIKQVAEEAGVSISSVSNILSGAGRYSYRAETEQRVRAAAQRLSYRGNAAARALRQQKTRLVGVAVDARFLHLSLLISAIYDALLIKDYKPILMEARQLSDIDSSPSFPSPDMLAGLISVDLRLENESEASYEMLGQNLPIIATYPVNSKRIHCVTTDRARAVEMAVEHLVALGHERIAFAQPETPNSPTSRMKARGWEQALHRFNLEEKVCPTLTTPSFDIGAERGADAARQLMTLKPKPTALFCGSDYMALGAMNELKKHGWKIPDDISIVGYDGREAGEYSEPALTTLRSQRALLARSAVEQLATIVEGVGVGQTKPIQQLVEPQLLVRGSTRQCNTSC